MPCTVGEKTIIRTPVPHLLMKRRPEKKSKMKTQHKPPCLLCHYRARSPLSTIDGLVGYRCSVRVRRPSVLAFRRVGSYIPYYGRCTERLALNVPFWFSVFLVSLIKSFIENRTTTERKPVPNNRETFWNLLIRPVWYNRI